MKGLEEEKHCEKEDCSCYYSCRYLKHRFNVKECAIGKKIFIDRRHKEELQDREKILKGVKEYGR